MEEDKNSFSPIDKGHLVEIVKMRTDALVSYSSRIWTLFNWFQTLNVGILGVILTNQVVLNENVFLLAVMSLLLSILWFFLGVNDFISMEKHKKIKKSLEEKLFTSLNMREELNEEKNSPKKILTLLRYNQTKSLFLVPLINSIISIIIIVNNFKSQIKLDLIVI
jgi:hypothetical protein